MSRVNMDRVKQHSLVAFLIAALGLSLSSRASTAESCGDGVFDAAIEECDDGNTEPGDGCDANCAIECTEVGQAATEHTCLHGSNGPFANQVATADGELLTADVSSPHTYFTIVLPGEPGANLSRVRFNPATSRPYAIYMKKPYPLRLLDEDGREAELFLEHAISSCAVADSLTWVRVFEALDAEQTYTVELGPYEETTLSIAFESLGFTGPLYRDADMDGHATRGEAVAWTWCAPPPGYSNKRGGDCDDTDPLTFPGAPELCDGKNSDCDGRQDEEEIGLCAESELGASCALFGEVTRCGCRDDDDCSRESMCNATGQCWSPAPGSGGEGGAPPGTPGSGSGAASGNAGAGSNAETSGGRSGVGGKASGGPNTGGKKGAPDTSNDEREQTSGSGCSCSVPSNRPTGPGWLLLAAPALMFLRGHARRRTQRTRSPVVALLTLLSTIAWSGSTRAALPPECEGLGKALTEHSCFHSTLGPFEFRIATPGNAAIETTPNVDPVHTDYRVLLTPGQSSLTYRPERSGSFTIFTGHDIPITIHHKGEAPRPVLFATTETGCEALPLARVYDLEAQLTYTLTFESEDASDVALVIEFVDDFLIENGIDRDGDGYGDPNEVVKSVCVPPPGYAQNTSDCDDTDPTIHPGAVERCGDSVDQNCNGLLDDTGLGCRVGIGACATQGISACGDDGHVFCVTSDRAPSEEICNGKDDDCDGQIDEESSLCFEPSRPHCVRAGFTATCGCQFDSDCASGDPDLSVCDVTLGVCIEGERAAGGAPGSGGEDGDASGGEASSGGLAEHASGGVGGEEPEGDRSGEDSKDGSGAGCSCNINPRFPAPPDLSILLVSSWMFWQRRRARTR